eukprot:GHVT01087294.1.p1 GENE.GHVT01087294.1~~GHVT01087294.1.p1  ORF type:complete len:740 (-),score=129.38 GHVT01087294.1:436-2655(-)
MMAPVTSASPSTSRISAACSWSSGCSSCCCCSSPAPGCRASSSGSHSVTAASPCGLVVAVLPQVQTYAWGVLGGASVVRQLRRACEDSLLRLARDWSAAVQEGGGGGDGGPGPREAAEEGARALASEEEEGRTARSQPAAELWLGLHPNGLNLAFPGAAWKSLGSSSCLSFRSLKASLLPLTDYFVEHRRYLGRLSALPYLLKVLAVNQPLSLQVHPDIEIAQELFQLSASATSSLPSSSSYPASFLHAFSDSGAKPEMAIALTTFDCMCGFRPLLDISRLILECPELLGLLRGANNGTFWRTYGPVLESASSVDKWSNPASACFSGSKFPTTPTPAAPSAGPATSPPPFASIGGSSPVSLGGESEVVKARERGAQVANEESVAIAIFATLLELNEADVAQACQALHDRLARPVQGRASNCSADPQSSNSFYGELKNNAEKFAKQLGRFFPNDVGVFAPFILNTLTLQPGEAIFIGPNLIHAYVKGSCLECMASSDNVVRGGLTAKPKKVDLLLFLLKRRLEFLKDNQVLGAESSVRRVKPLDVDLTAATLKEIPATSAGHNLTNNLAENQPCADSLPDSSSGGSLQSSLNKTTGLVLLYEPPADAAVLDFRMFILRLDRGQVVRHCFSSVGPCGFLVLSHPLGGSGCLIVDGCRWPAPLNRGVAGFISEGAMAEFRAENEAEKSTQSSMNESQPHVKTAKPIDGIFSGVVEKDDGELGETPRPLVVAIAACNPAFPMR